ncbi:MAG: response regulator [Chitinophagaceae bacterium]
MKKLLLIEDNDDIRENTAEILELANYHVVTASNGKTGVEEAIKFKPDLIICDIMMPVLDGYEVFQMLRQHKETRDTPFIFLTAKAERTEIRKGMDIGADDYITKPFVAIELLNAIESRFKRVGLKKNLPTALLKFEIINSDNNNPDEIINQFILDRRIICLKKKQLVYTEGNHPSALYYVLKGKAKSFKSNEEGKELAIDLFCEGDFIGYTALLDGSFYKESVSVMTDAELSVIPRKDFEELISSHWEIARRFIKMMVKNASENEDHLIGLAYNSIRKKVAEALIKLLVKYGDDQADFMIDISRVNLATIAGTATESLIRTLSDFREEKLIDLSEGKILILNEKKLKDMMN